MYYKKKIIKLTRVYIFFLSSVLFINIGLTTSLNANLFKINDLEISEPFELNFNKEKVINKGFKKAFLELISMITTSGDKKLIKNTNLSTIKGLIDSFTMNNERFVNNEYKANFDVNFNKKNTLKFFEKQNIFPSIPLKKDILLIPVLIDIDKNEILLFNDNEFYKIWNQDKKKYHLLNYLLPSEDLEDVSLIKKNKELIEDYNFKEITDKYILKDYIVTIIYKEKDIIRILSKIHLNQLLKIDSHKFQNINLKNQKDIDLILIKLKTIYENYWKNLNQINTSIKLPLTVSINSKKHDTITILENTFNEFDLLSSYEVSKIDNEKIYFKIIYNGPPDKFIKDLKDRNIFIKTENEIWEIQ